METSTSISVSEEDTNEKSNETPHKTDCDFVDIKTDDSNDCGTLESCVKIPETSVKDDSHNSSVIEDLPEVKGQRDCVDNLHLEQMYIKGGKMQHLQSSSNNNASNAFSESDPSNGSDHKCGEGCTLLTILTPPDPGTGFVCQTNIHICDTETMLPTSDGSVTIDDRESDSDSDSKLSKNVPNSECTSNSAIQGENINKLDQDHKYYKNTTDNDNTNCTDNPVNVKSAQYEELSFTEIRLTSSEPISQNLKSVVTTGVMDTDAGEESESSLDKQHTFLVAQEGTASSADSESDSSSSSDDDSSMDEQNTEQQNESQPKPYRKKYVETLARGELSLDDLPRIEELTISVPPSECEAVGRVFSIVKQLVVVESLPNTPALDLDSVLFRESGHPLGEIFDVFGPVKNPFYCIRFNNNEEIVNKKIEKGELIYCAPQTDYTRYVFVHRLMLEKGSDASWRHDTEVPEELKDYSDDEAERVARRPTSESNGLKDGGTNRKRRHSSFGNKANNNNSKNEPWYRTKLDERRSFGPHEASPVPRPPVFSPVATYRPSIPSPFSARRPPPPFSVATGCHYRDTPMASGPPRLSLFPPTPTTPSSTPMGPRLNMYSPLPPPPSVTGSFSKSLTFPPPFVPNYSGSPQTPPTFGSSNPFNLSSIPPSLLDKPPPFPILPQLDTPPPNFPHAPPPRIGCLPRPNLFHPPPRQPPPPRPPPFSQQQYHLY